MGKKTYQKRLKVTKGGKILRRHSNLGHNEAKKSSKTKRKNKRIIIVKQSSSKRLLKQLH